MKNYYRIETDTMGEVKVPSDKYWGAQTQRAIDNFPVSGIKFHEIFIQTLGLVKYSAAKSNIELKKIDKKTGEAIMQAAKEVADGKLDDHFMVDIFQTGSGTSTNMNANEVIAERANEILGEDSVVHPNDHVNMGQSSNDVIPTAIHISAKISLEKELLPVLTEMESILNKQTEEFDGIIKIGRTHLQDATPIRLGQEFSGYANQIKHGIKRINNTLDHLSELPIGGTAVGTGINTHPNFAELVIKNINELTGLNFREAENHFEAQAAKDTVIEVSSALKTAAVSLIKIANDIRFLGSGPRCGIGELILPPVQPGSSIMPGKVNPVMSESLMQVCAQVIGNDTTITTAGALGGNLELHVMMPVMAYNLLQSIFILANGIKVFTEKCLTGLKADEKKCGEMIEKSLAVCTVLAPKIGYESAAKIAKEAYETGKTIREISAEKNVLTPEELNKVMDPYSMTGI